MTKSTKSAGWRSMTRWNEQTRRRATVAGLLVILATALVWLFVIVGSRRLAEKAASAPTASVLPEPPPAPGRRIKAQLFYVAEDGLSLSGVEREVPYAEQAVDQAREIINAQLAPVDQPLVSAVPGGTVLRALFLTPEGDAFVDLSPEISRAHPGGSLGELLTVYTIVDALTINLPVVRAVQILVAGKEVDTLAGHVDIRRPLPKNLAATSRGR